MEGVLLWHCKKMKNNKSRNKETIEYKPDWLVLPQIIMLQVMKPQIILKYSA